MENGSSGGVNINIGTDGGSISDSSIDVSRVASQDVIHRQSNDGRYKQAQEEISSLRQRVHELEQFVFGDEKLGLVGMRQELKGLKFWIICNTAVTILWALYEIIGLAARSG